MESLSTSGRPSFRALQARLLAFVRAKINNGEFSERGLAKSLGISQPQLHNVLKGARSLQPDVADSLMSYFEISVLELLTPEEVRRCGELDRLRCFTLDFDVTAALDEGNSTPRKGVSLLTFEPQVRKAG